jgi:aldose 1-epimerase
MQHIDGSEISVAIDLDQGARIASLQWRDLQFVVPFRGAPLTRGWYSMAPWAGRIRDAEIRDSKGTPFQLPNTWFPPHAIHGLAFDASWQDIGKGRARLELGYPYNGAVVEQTIEVLDNAVRWIIEYEANGVDLPAWLGYHPWFPRQLARGEEAEVNFRAAKQMERGDEVMLTGKFGPLTQEPWDDCFTEVIGVPSITWANAAKVTVESDSPWWVVYTEDDEGVCIEPHTAPPDAQNLGFTGEHYLEALFTFTED